MTDLAFRIDSRAALTAPAVWSGRILSGVIGGFLAIEGLTRLLAGRALVPPSEAAPVLAPAVQTGLGAALILGAVLLAPRPTRLVGAVLLSLCIAGLLGAELRAPAPSPSHILFWAYVGLLTWAGSALSRLR
ncbi:hypothetical protein [Brevundimonas sp.]|uniref:hypothetical protein n=1 Tax=Brevundimonas sp. TaxID=1871086 RepID=UPI002C5F0FEC|nr:hypothetical protein [Brevundimonas sp.]HWQ87437.1 hypothetical protein [Brevundimonas sp.]